MASLTAFNIRFTLRWRMGIFALLAIMLFTRLGFWQIERAKEKKQMLTAHETLAKKAPIVWQPGDKLPAHYQQLQVHGNFLPHVLLLDNQHYQHQFGYHVISPLQLADGHIVLIDRGWVAGDITRQSFPAIHSPLGEVNLTGSAYYPSAKNWALGEVIEKKQANLTIVELINTQLLSQFLHKSVYPFIIRQSKADTEGYIREWPIVAMSPQRHYAYAVQWFAMAFVILILFLTIKKHHEK